mmetsp:Transcript_222/g.523  ORF Transcript_222/g.523 Transcript_222/m.523 type:complete len:389 (-) Transcript_222:329-1495(-)
MGDATKPKWHPESDAKGRGVIFHGQDGGGDFDVDVISNGQYHPEDGKRRLDESGDADDAMNNLDDAGGDGDVDEDEESGIADDATDLVKSNEHRLQERVARNGAGGSAEQHAVVDCTTTAGPIKMHLHRSWSPHGYDRASSLFERGYYDHSHFFRVVPHFLVQFGISYTQDEDLNHFADSHINDDPKREDLMPFREGYISFAGGGPNTRTSQLFIAYDRSGGLGTSPWETPFGEVVKGIENARNLHSGYGDMPPWGKGPEQGPIRNQGSKYIEEKFPLLDKFVRCTVSRTYSLQNDYDPNGDPAVGVLGEEAGDDFSEEEFPEGGHHELRGGGVKVQPSSIDKESDHALTEKKGTCPLCRIAVIVVCAIIVVQVFARRKKRKDTGKSV